MVRGWCHGVRLAVSTLVGLLGFAVPQVAICQAASYGFQPFLAHTATTHYGPNGSQVGMTYETFGRRSDGSTFHAFEVTSPTGERNQVIEFTDLHALKEVVLEPFTLSVITYYLSDKRAQQQRELQSAACASMYDDSKDAGMKIMGMPATLIHEGRRGSISTAMYQRRWAASF